jgi:two-component system KDP operon response regulator KdpE
VLVVDDEPQIVRALVINLKARKYEVDAAPDGRTALELAASRHPDVVVLDLGLPDMDGVEVCRQLRTFTDCYVLMLTARTEEIDRLVGLRETVSAYFKQIGFQYITVDLEGFRSGSLNEVLKP